MRLQPGFVRGALALVVIAAAACRAERGSSDANGGAERAGRATGADTAAVSRAPADSGIPADSLGAAIRRGLALMMHAPDSLPAHAPGKISCTNCHLQAGRSPDASSLVGTFARYPKYLERTGAVVGLADRINYCFTRSLAGTKLPPDSREMQDIIAYLAFLSRGIPVGSHAADGAGGRELPQLVGDTVRGAEVYRTACAACHGPDGEGLPGFPALWGPKSYSVGASMARQGRAASFIWNNMPFGNPRSLTEQQAFDVAAYINSKPRPDSPGKELDWPHGGAPKDVPYDLRSGHRAYKSPPLLPRANAAGAIVPAPRSVVRGTED